MFALFSVSGHFDSSVGRAPSTLHKFLNLIPYRHPLIIVQTFSLDFVIQKIRCEYIDLLEWCSRTIGNLMRPEDSHSTQEDAYAHISFPSLPTSLFPERRPLDPKGHIPDSANLHITTHGFEPATEAAPLKAKCMLVALDHACEKRFMIVEDLERF
jgi:hypothetical protein